MKCPHTLNSGAYTKLRSLLLITTLVAGFATIAYGAATDIASGPLALPATNVKPNLLLILDDSGSMARQYTPDYLANNNCFNPRDSNNPPTASPVPCFPGDPPVMSPDFNTQYYNPEIRYYPAVNYDGSSKGEMNAANTSNWTAVPTDNVSGSGVNDLRKGLHLGNLNNNNPDSTHWGTVTPTTALTTMNLVTGFPDRVWCNSTGATATDTAVCKTNSGYTYPTDVFGYGRDGSSNRKYITGAPYYYRIVASEYCTTASLTTCVAATAPTTVSGVVYNVPALVRFCNSTAHTNCQAKRSGSYIYPKFLGTVNATASVAAAYPVGQIDITTGSSSAATITQITITKPDTTTVNLLTSNLVNSVGTSSSGNQITVTNEIVTRINQNQGSHGYQASCTGAAYGSVTPSCTASLLFIRTPTIGIAGNGSSITVTAPATTLTPAWLQFDVGGANSNSDQLNQLRVGPAGSVVDLITSSITCGSSCSNSKMGGLIRTAVNALTSTHGYVASGSGATVRITAQAGTGAERNGWPLTWSDSGLTDVSASLANGISAGSLSHTTSNFTGGVDAVTGSWARVDVGNFSRTNILSGLTYTKFPARTDCSSAPCTYAEEMTNFANWFAYYRTRMHMAKAAIGRAFVGLSNDFRVGFFTINNNSSGSLAVADFSPTAGGHKEQWYTNLYNALTGNSTPLRSALTKAGRYYGNKSPIAGMGASPITMACQPNFTILTTDGYWNESEPGGYQLDGVTAIGDQDGVNSGYSTQAIGAYDANSARNTLADVAMYYYKTDLRPDLQNFVPTTSKDTASHQHMTTFTVGLGLAGTLTYDPGYETQETGDFKDIKSGIKSWPVPVSNGETTLDDLWHAAVNGRGTFFSAKDPVTLSNSIVETLNAVAARVGAGAAAATSNLQPVAGDNFAFTAQFQTVEWSGDLKARTIDLTTGTVSNRELWSAQELLDGRGHLTRRIYTFDAGDTSAAATVTVAGVSRTQNANKLRSFCWTDAPVATYPQCDDGGLLTAAELTAHFNPLGGTNGALGQSVPWPTDGSGRHLSATKNNLVDFIRGDNDFETTGGTATSDLYRDRAHVLGDIINAQPAYVKSPPLTYTDAFYSTFKSNNATRQGTVYVAANDGMLHAFATDPDNNPYYQTSGIGTASEADDAFTGTLNTSSVNGEGSERWAFITSMVFPDLKRLAETNYGTNHRYLADGSPAVGDVCFGHTTATPCSAASNWKTLLVAGLNAGGRGFYALDVTDPAAPKGLWELKGGGTTTCLTDSQANAGTFFEDCNIGLSFGNPLIVKRPSDGKWVVILSSGHNNVSPGNGKGYVYVIDAQTGAILQRLATGVGCDGVSSTAPCTAGTVDPSGLTRLNAWVENSAEDNTALTVYGGDLKGNLWRFELAGTASVTANSVTRLTTLVDGSGNAQPVTTRPELGLVGASSRIVYVGTGKFLGTSDNSSDRRQSVYAIKDTMGGVTSPVYSAIRSDSNFIQQTLSAISGDRRTASNNSVDLLTASGWYIDLPDGGSGSPSERVSVDPVLQLGTLIIPSNVPSTDACVAGGYGWVNFLNARTGSFITGSTDNMASTKIAASLIVGINVVRLPGGTVKVIVTTADNQQLTESAPVAPTTAQGRRVSWRELSVDR